MTTLKRSAASIHLRLPATSANLGPAFDTAAVALNLHLEVTAQAAENFAISARGRNAEACGQVEGNLILETYRQILLDQGRPVQPLHLDVNNEIPLGMGCGSSAAARLAGIVLAIEFGELGWPEEEILSAATYLEGHPDNVTACWLGGMTVSAVSSRKAENKGRNSFPCVHVARIEIPAHWKAVMVLPLEPMRTAESRKVLPDAYTRADVVENLQHSSLLVAAFASGRSDLLQAAMHDTLHQPYRRLICPLLGKLLPLCAEAGILGVALSGAGPGVLLIVERNLENDRLNHAVETRLGEEIDAEVVPCGFVGRGANRVFDKIHV